MLSADQYATTMIFAEFSSPQKEKGQPAVGTPPILVAETMVNASFASLRPLSIPS